MRRVSFHRQRWRVCDARTHTRTAPPVRESAKLIRRVSQSMAVRLRVSSTTRWLLRLSSSRTRARRLVRCRSRLLPSSATTTSELVSRVRARWVRTQTTVAATTTSRTSRLEQAQRSSRARAPTQARSRPWARPLSCLLPRRCTTRAFLPPCRRLTTRTTACPCTTSLSLALWRQQ